MSPALRVLLALSLFGSEAMACIGIPPKPMRLRGASFDGVDLRIGDGLYGSGLQTDDGQITYHPEFKKWCITEDIKRPDKVQCLDANTARGLDIKLRNKEGTKTVGAVQILDRSIYVWSVDATGKIDKSKPFLEIRDSSALSETSREDMCRAADCPRINYGYQGKITVIANQSANAQENLGRWDYNSGARGSYTSLNGRTAPAKLSYSSIYRSVSVGGDAPPADISREVELSGSHVTTGGCGKTEIRNFSTASAAGGTVPTGAAGTVNAIRDATRPR